MSFEHIQARHFNLDIKNPHVGELVSHDPGVLLAEFAGQQAEIQGLRDRLKEILAAALGGK